MESSVPQPQVSVIIPAYNAASFILKTIHSVQTQTWRDWELIVVDDGSTDDTRTLVGGLHDDRIRLFTYPNGGVSTARNRGFAHSQGKYIALLDADDLWSAQKLADQVQAMENQPQAGLAYSQVCLMNAQGNQFALVRCRELAGNVYAEMLTSHFLHTASNIFLRREVWETLGGFDPELYQGGDWEFCVRVAAQWDFIYIPKPQVYYRQHPRSISFQVKTVELYNLKVIDKVFQSCPAHLQFRQAHAKASCYQNLARLYLARATRRSEVNQAWSFLVTAVKFRPGVLINRGVIIAIFELLFLTIFSVALGRSLLKLCFARSVVRNVSGLGT